MNRLLILSTLLVGSALSLAAPVLPTLVGPTPEVTKAIAERRERLREFAGQRRERMNAREQQEFDEKTAKHFEELTTSLSHTDPYLFAEVVRDLSNGEYGGFAQDRIAALLLPRLKTAETHSIRIDAQAWIMRFFAYRNNPAAKEALPALLAFVSDDNAAHYLRTMAVETSTRIAPGDANVLKTFTTVLEKPEAKKDVGLHNRIVEQLGTMGKAALPTKDVLVKLFASNERYQETTIVALGKITRDEKPQALDVYLQRLEKLDALPVDQTAAAFYHIVELGRTGQKRYVGNPSYEEEIIRPEVARAARPMLLKVLTRPNDFYVRAALKALRVFGIGSSPQTAKLLVHRLIESRRALEAARQAIVAAKPDERTAKEQAFNKLSLNYPEDELLAVLAKLEPTEKEAVVPLIEAFREFTQKTEHWHIAQRLAKIITRYGKHASPAVPDAIRALRALPLGIERSAYNEVFADYLAIMSAVGAEPRVIQTINELLEPTSPALTQSGPHASELQMYLLLALAKIHLPQDKEERATSLKHMRTALASDLPEVVSAATKVIVATKDFTKEESAPLVKSLARVLTDETAFRKFPAESPRHLSWAFTHAEQLMLGRGHALQALASLGPLAKEAIPAVKTLAERDLEQRTSDYIPEPAINAVIREARKTKKVLEESK